ncbi:MAG: helix-turn-helix transcriptional regulator [Bacteroidetes bacterium]|nr:helix-turn-helix transcriptional regulator [Bacteroidota bacterium]
MNKVIGERIRIQRVSKSLSQENIADELDLSIGAYSNIERGKTEISVSRLYRIAKILKISPAQLLDVNPDTKNEVNESAGGYHSVQKQLNDLAEKISDFQRIVEDQKKEINYLKEIIGLLKKKKNEKRINRKK